MKKSISFIIISFSFFISACTSVQEQHGYVDYTSLSSILYKVEHAEKLLNEGKITDALLYSRILELKTSGINEVAALKLKSTEQVEAAFNKSIEERDWETSLRFFRSLTAAGNQPKGWSEDRIFKSRKAAWETKGHIPLLNMEEKKSEVHGKNESRNIAQMIKGTVTVWVDKGTKIEKGYGFADITIGSGFFIDKRGYFITNYHVIQSEVDPNYNGYSKLYIKSPYDYNIKVSAKVIGWDPLFDLALLKTEVTPDTIFGLGSSKNLEVGSKIFAIGSPAGLDKTLTSGIVSAKYRRLFSMVDVMQIDAAVNHGNSGGPIVDENGLVQAVVFAGLERNEGLNFAIPVELLKLILPELYLGGEVKHSWLGGYGKTQKHDAKPAGVEVSYILPNGPLSVSGIKEGSIITEFNGMPVTTVEEIQMQLLSVAPDTIVTLKISGKDGTNQSEYPVLCKERSKMPGSDVFKNDSDWRAMLPIFGFYLEPAGKRHSFRVIDVIPGSFADEAGFSTNDYIELNGKKLDRDNDEIVHIRIYAKKVKAGYIDSFMVFSGRLDNPFFF